MLNEWEDLLTKDERAVAESLGLSKRIGLGRKPSLLIVDLQYSFVGLRAPLAESVKVYPRSAGESAWRAVEKIGELREEFHKRGNPVIYTKASGVQLSGMEVRATKSSLKDGPNAEEIVSEVKPQKEDVVIEKVAASAFQGTPLVRYLNSLSVDTVIVTGGVTSGCVRASAVDAFSLGYRVAVVKDAVFDRFSISHRVSLMDLSLKYADIVTTEEVKSYLRELEK
ncbi:hydrolase [Sulfodiicoccus acidiphilus]|uniref:Hydrolase n=1 Tax=Sulfodiicoccus acidiphilus TaxID=1670455 RepID=A0A348B1V1_9CREN|nr:isochorismatase family protein [Sulfodiicoccus acidiphilus]BBD72153.1 hydrolase [Sulfodiicoccus acidiphilus]GGT94619.1 hydrolase [Sulfodiicoccus acidiphilus]